MGKSRKNERNPKLNKDRDYLRKDTKFHKVGSEFRTNIRQSLKKVLRGELSEEEFEEAYGESEEI